MPTRARKYQTIFKKYREDRFIQVSGGKVLSIIVKAKLSQYQYNIIRFKD